MLRQHYINQVSNYQRTHPVVALLGPRQVGKTTLAKQFIEQQSLPVHYFDLEDPDDLASLENAKLTLSELSGLIVIDEIQRRPNLFPLLRTLVDNHRDQHYLILGSASRDLIQQSSETLAGRIAYLEITPFYYPEIDNWQEAWLRGGFPKSYLAENLEDSLTWRKFYISTFLERDLPNLGIHIAPTELRRFWTMLAHYHANICNYSEIGRSLNLTDKVIKNYCDLLTSTFMIRQLQPWYINISKRIVKRPKIYIRDSGILHSLLTIKDWQSLMTHPKVGASWEGFALETIINYHQATPQECYFYATHNQAELDLLLTIDGKKIGFEIKNTDSPSMTKSMHQVLSDLPIDQLIVIYPGERDFPLQEKVRAMGLTQYLAP